MNLSIYLCGGILAFGAASFVAAQVDPSGGPEKWEGALKSDNEMVPISLTFTLARDPTDGMAIRGTGTFGTIRNVTLGGRWGLPDGQVRIEAASESGKIQLRGRTSREILRGTGEINGRTGELTLVRVAELGAPEVARFAGSYLLSKDHLVVIARTQFGLSFVDFKTGETRAMTPLSANSLSAATALFGRVPVDFRIDLQADDQGSTRGILIEHRGDVEFAKRLSFRRESVSFRSGDILLSGTLILPNRSGPHPAIVRTHGSGGATRDTPAAEWFAHNGIAFLAYDKRGAGTSTGDWRTASIEDLASDALAGVAFLKARRDIDSQRIGLSGGSEGAWVAPQAAAVSGDVGFLYVGAFSGHRVDESILWRIETLLRARNRFTEQEVREALELRRAYNRAVLTGSGWEELSDRVAQEKSKAWFSLARVPAALPNADSPTVAYEKRMLAFDPESAWSKVTVPVLFLAGGRDRSVASTKTWPRIEGALQAAGNKKYALRVFATANHEGLDAVTGDDDEFPTLHRYAPGYFDAIMDWLRTVLKLP